MYASDVEADHELVLLALASLDRDRLAADYVGDRVAVLAQQEGLGFGQHFLAAHLYDGWTVDRLKHFLTLQCNNKRNYETIVLEKRDETTDLFVEMEFGGYVVEGDGEERDAREVFYVVQGREGDDVFDDGYLE